MLEKYIEERFPRYFEFGSSNDGRVDIASIQYDTICTVSPNQVSLLIEERDKAIDMIIKLAQKLDEVSPEDFKNIWY